jgi:hypothetical protein
VGSPAGQGGWQAIVVLRCRSSLPGTPMPACVALLHVTIVACASVCAPPCRAPGDDPGTILQTRYAPFTPLKLERRRPRVSDTT